MITGTMLFGRGDDAEMDEFDGAPILNVLPLPVIAVGADNRIVHANTAAEAFFEQSSVLMRRQTLANILPFGSPVLPLENTMVSVSSTLQRLRPRTKRSSTHPGRSRTVRNVRMRCHRVTDSSTSSR